MEARAEIQKQLDETRKTMDWINYKVSRYEEAIRTGILTWDADQPR